MNIRRLLSWTVLAVLAASCRSVAPVVPTSPPPPSPSSPRRVVLLSLDGAGTETLHQLYREGQLSAGGFARFFREGQVADRLVPVDPTLTATNHISLATGYPAGRTGIVGNSFHPAGSPFSETVSGFAAPIGTETLWEAARRQGKRVGVTTWPGADDTGPRRRADWGMVYVNDADRRSDLVTWTAACGNRPTKAPRPGNREPLAHPRAPGAGRLRKAGSPDVRPAGGGPHGRRQGRLRRAGDPPAGGGSGAAPTPLDPGHWADSPAGIGPGSSRGDPERRLSRQAPRPRPRPRQHPALLRRGVPAQGLPGRLRRRPRRPRARLARRAGRPAALPIPGRAANASTSIPGSSGPFADPVSSATA